MSNNGLRYIALELMLHLPICYETFMRVGNLLDPPPETRRNVCQHLRKAHEIKASLDKFIAIRLDPRNIVADTHCIPKIGVWFTEGGAMVGGRII